MSNACSFCQLKESTSAGKWLACGDCAGRRDPPSTLCDTFADNGYASSVDLWAPNAPAPVRCNICRSLDAAQHRESVVGEYKSRCAPASVRRDMFMVRPRMAELRRATPLGLACGVGAREEASPALEHVQDWRRVGGMAEKRLRMARRRF